MLKWQKPKQSQKEIRLSEIGKELDFIEMQIENPKLLRPVLYFIAMHTGIIFGDSLGPIFDSYKELPVHQTTLSNGLVPVICEV